MSVTLHTVDNGTVNAINDAKFYEQLTNSICGIVAGAEVTASGGLVVHITSGWGIIQGRLFTITAEDITVEPATDGTMNGRLKLVINLANDEPISIESERATTLPSLVQENLNSNGTVYELALATYSVSMVAVSDLVSNTKVAIAPAQPLSGTVGSATRPVYLNNGTLTRGTYTIASVTTLPESPDANTIYLVTE